MGIFDSITPKGLTLFAVLISFVAIAGLDSDELDVLGNLLIGIGGLLVVAASQGEYLDSIIRDKLNDYEGKPL